MSTTDGPTPVAATPPAPSPAKAAPRIWTVFAVPCCAWVAILGAQCAALVGVGIWLLLRGTPQDRLITELMATFATPAGIILNGAAIQGAVFATALLAAFLSPKPTARRLGLVRPSLPATGYLALLIGTWLPLAAGQGLMTALAGLTGPAPAPEALYTRITAAWALPYVLFISLAPAFCEETLFRGYVQRRLLRRWPSAASIAVSSVLFAGYHTAPHAIAAILPLGVWLGWVASRTGSILPGVACHAFNNATLTVWYLGVYHAGWPDKLPAAPLAVAVSIALAGFIISVRMLSKTPAAATQLDS